MLIIENFFVANTFNSYDVLSFDQRTRKASSFKGGRASPYSILQERRLPPIPLVPLKIVEAQRKKMNKTEQLFTDGKVKPIK